MKLKSEEEKSTDTQDEFNDPDFLEKNQLTVDEWIKTIPNYGKEVSNEQS